MEGREKGKEGEREGGKERGRQLELSLWLYRIKRNEDCWCLTKIFNVYFVCSRWVFNVIHGSAIGLFVEILACELCDSC